MRDTHHALSRALSFCFGATAFDVEEFFQRATWELHHSLESEVAAMALVIRRGDGSCFVGRSRDGQALPVETLLGMLVEKHGERLTCRVRDHALDTVRFLDHRFRTSVLVSVDIPEVITRGGEAALWFGLPGGAHPRFVSLAENMGQEVSEWLLWYGAIIQAHTLGAVERSRQVRRLEYLTGLIHDARAPLGVLKYMARREGGAECVATMLQELEYLERILSQGAPESHPQPLVSSCDVGGIVRGVYRRCFREDSEAGLMMDVGYRSVYARFPPLELERIVTNLVSNAQRHAPHARVRMEVEERADSVVVHVKDKGPGIPARTLRALLEGSIVRSRIETGWGIGLRSCIEQARRFNGELLIASREGEGTCVSVVMPRGETPYEVQQLEVADGGSARRKTTECADVWIVDDDAEHSVSLERLLRSFGLEVRRSNSLEAFLSEVRRDPVSSVLCDAHMPDGGAERLLPLLAACSRASRLAVVSGDASEDHVYRLAALGAQAFFTKPVDIDEVVAWIRAR